MLEEDKAPQWEKRHLSLAQISQKRPSLQHTVSAGGDFTPSSGLRLPLDQILQIRRTPLLSNDVDISKWTKNHDNVWPAPPPRVECSSYYGSLICTFLLFAFYE